MEGQCSEPWNLDDFAVAKWLTEFGKIFHGKLGPTNYNTVSMTPLYFSTILSICISVGRLLS